VLQSSAPVIEDVCPKFPEKEALLIVFRQKIKSL
jgi:hypothetical protein